MRRNISVIFISLFLISIASAEIRLQKKSLISRGDPVITPAEITENTLTGDTLICWVDYFAPAKIHIRIVNAKGKAITPPLDVTPAGWGFGSDDVDPVAVAYNPVTNEYLLAYSGTPDSGSVDGLFIFVQRLDTSGKRIGPAVNVSHDPLTDPFNQNLQPFLQFNPKTGGYTLFWFVHAVNAVQGDSFESKLFLDKQGTPNAPLQKIACCRPDGKGVTCTCGIYYTGTYLPSRKKELLFGLSLAENEDAAYYKMAVVNPMLKNANPRFVTINQQPAVDPIPGPTNLGIWNITAAFLPDGSGILYYVDSTNVKGQRFSKKGKLTGSSFVAFNSPQQNTQLFWPSAAFTDTSKGTRGILIATEDPLLDGGSITWAQMVDEEGKPIGKPVRIYTARGSKTVKAGAVVAQPSTITDNSFNFIWYGTLAKVPVYGVPLGNQIVKLTLSLTP